MCPSIDPPVEEIRRVFPPADWADWLGIDFRGAVNYRRTFGQPTGLVTGQPVWLCVTEVDWSAEIVINDQTVGSLTYGEPMLRKDIRPLLHPRNRLDIVIAMPNDVDPAMRGEREGFAGGLIGLVWLEM